MKVAGARILVVGGVRRLGRALALDLAGHGAAVAVSSRARTRAADEQVAALLAAGAPGRRTGRRATPAAPAGAAGLVAAAADGARRPRRPRVRRQRPLRAHAAASRSTRPTWDASLDTIAKGFFFSACAAHEPALARAA